MVAPRRPWLALVALASATVTLAPSSCGSAGSLPSADPPPAAQLSDPQGPIGTATMQADGTLILMLRAEDPSGAITGDAMFTYVPGTKDYEDVLKHIGGLKPGESKPVPPWPQGG